MTTLTIPLLVCAFLDTARSRKRAVTIVQQFLAWGDGTPLSDAEALALVEAYYAQHGDGKPWLKRKGAA